MSWLPVVACQHLSADGWLRGGVDVELGETLNNYALAAIADGNITAADIDGALARTLDEALAKLPIPKVMTYQLADGWSDVKFVRPAHKLLALHGADVVPLQTLGLQAGRSTLGHRFEAVQAVVEITHHDLGGAQPRGLTAHRLAGINLAHHELAPRLAEISRRNGAPEITTQRPVNGRFGLGPLIRLTSVGDAEQAAGPGIPSPGVDLVDQTGTIAHLTPEHGAFPLPQHDGQQIQRRGVGVRQAGDRPREHRPAKLDLLGAVFATRGKLPRFGWNQHRDRPAPGDRAEVPSDLREDRGGIDIPDHDYDQILGHVALAIVGE